MNKVVQNARSLMAVVALAAAVLMVSQGAQGRGGPHGDMQDTLGPVPGPTDPDIQQQLEALKDQNEAIIQLICLLHPGATACNQKIVFITEAVSNGDLGGLSGADDVCAAEATAAGLLGTYLAWLSASSGSSPSTRFAQSTVPYVLVNGVRVADDWVDLTSGGIQSPINIEADGDDTGASFVWSGTNPDGTNLTVTCFNWVLGGSGASGRAGSPASTDGRWSSDTNRFCNNTHPHYCFQQ